MAAISQRTSRVRLGQMVGCNSYREPSVLASTHAAVVTTIEENLRHRFAAWLSTRQGLVNEWEPRARRRLQLMEGSDLRHGLAVTAANEHFTALFAEWMLSHPEVFNHTEPRLKNLWLWHSAEEAEHKCTAFDLYQALGGSHTWRVKWMRRVTVFFLTDALRQTALNLHRDGTPYGGTP